MALLAELGAALALSSAVVLAFAVLRSLMRAEPVPRLLDSTILAFAFSLVFTMLIMVSMIVMSHAMQGLTNSATYSFFLTLFAHIAIWSVARLIVPARAALPMAGTGAVAAM